MIHKISILIIIIALILSAAPLMAGNPEKEKAAVISAEKWLGLVDSTEIPGKLERSCRVLQECDYSRTMETVSYKQSRKPLGKVITRKVKTKTYRTSLPGAPDGEYVVIEFDTSFDHKKSAIETVTPMLDKDGIWRVSGYYIK